MRLAPTTITGSLVLLSTALSGVASDSVPRSVQVSARSELTVPPDEVLLSFRINTMDQDLLKAKQQNDDITESAMALAPAFNVPAADVKIIGLDVRPETSREGIFLHYSFSRTVQLRIMDFTQLEPVITGLIEAGVTQVYRLQYRVRDQRKHQEEARELAVEYAREKADHLAQLTGLTLGKPITILTDVESAWDIGGFGGGFGGIGLVPLNSAADRLAAYRPDEHPNAVHLTSLLQTEATPDDSSVGQKARGMLFAPGVIEINATVSITYELIDTPQ